MDFKEKSTETVKNILLLLQKYEQAVHDTFLEINMTKQTFGLSRVQIRICFYT